MKRETKKNLGEKHSERLNNIITDVIISSWDCSGQSKSNNSEKPWIRMSSKITNVITDLRNFMFENIYLPIGVTREGKISKEIVKILFEHYRNNIDMIPDYIKSISNSTVVGIESPWLSPFLSTLYMASVKIETLR